MQNVCLFSMLCLFLFFSLPLRITPTPANYDITRHSSHIAYLSLNGAAAAGQSTYISIQIHSRSLLLNCKPLVSASLPLPLIDAIINPLTKTWVWGWNHLPFPSSKIISQSIKNYYRWTASINLNHACMNSTHPTHPLSLPIANISQSRTCGRN